MKDSKTAACKIYFDAQYTNGNRVSETNLRYRVPGKNIPRLQKCVFECSDFPRHLQDAYVTSTFVSESELSALE